MKLFYARLFNGWFGEAATRWGLAQGLDTSVYWPLHDIIIPNSCGGTTQIDHILLSRFGLFVIETKNRNGLISGTPEQRNWRQILNGRTFEFFNPLMQNEGHIRALARRLNLPHSALHSIIFFCGTVRFAGPMPMNVRADGVTTIVHSKTNLILTEAEVLQAWNMLCACKRNPNLSEANHLAYLRSLGPHSRHPVPTGRVA